MRANLVALGELADFVNGAAFKPEDWGESGLPIIRIQNLTDSSKPFNYTERAVPRKLVVEPGDLLVSWSATLGVFQWEGPRGLLNQHIFRVLPDSSIVDRGYFKHALGRAIVEMERHLHGATMKHVNRGEFLGTKIPLPPLEQQQRIAAILDKADSLKAHARLREKSLSSFEDSLFHHFFGGIAGQANRWHWQKFGDLCSRLTVGVVVKPASYYCESGVPALRSLNVKAGAISEENLVFISDRDNNGALAKSRLATGDLVFVRSGRPGTCAVIPPRLDGCNAIDLLLATVDQSRILPEFVSSYFNSYGGRASILSESRGQIQQHFNAGSLVKAPIPVPPVTLQQEFCTVLKQKRLQAKRCDSSLAALGRLSSALSSDFFGGD